MQVLERFIYQSPVHCILGAYSIPYMKYRIPALTKTGVGNLDVQA